MNTTENNKLIAEFMGLVEPYELLQHGTIRPNGDFKTRFTSAQLKYHTSWNWLMPVVEKIGELGYYTMIITASRHAENWTTIYEVRDRNGNDKANVETVMGYSTINNTYKAVIKFIKWYNENK